ncbi:MULTISPECIES: Na+/H+ antiporter subunit C [Gammaproteobacteria]|uniref:Na+/H+ antiporter subunit C n=1 Tax=Gammaproteobacteria TaxID=1236 RepID=UPI001ADD0070|nr:MULTISPECIES: Na+/H+ antiporter subunit C [Gammaproteobacteria]MBO9482038.1 Na+/H+ antiporter subunit C [Salinisphaera sp. G21_0]MBO9494182.1 Na+/H+ antiporter subunit C [Thalassotalea sp. G20_0]WBA82250.1 Na+/H+ antiporter subunit C [Endozoicomonas sp. GU-1]WBA85187.1 Na+/H+ antiporter subunit C [Endozoicomonas sp. GU-1]
MEFLWCLVVGLMTACGVFLMLERHIVRFLFGMILVSNAINLAIFVAGRLTRGNPPLIASDALLPAAGYANPLPQALILTAIVIGFGLLLFTLLLAYRAIKEFGTADMDKMQHAETEQ